jgi:adenine-specific DNA-methyltransferase
MDKGGFDVIVGNPPYLKEMDSKAIFDPIKKSEYGKYYQGKMDLWYLFLHRAIDVVKEGGYIGFITNSYFLKSSGASKLIERIKKELVLLKLIDLDDIKVFGDVSGKHIIHVYQKGKSTKTDKTTYVKVNRDGFNNNISETKSDHLIYESIITEDNKIDFTSKSAVIFKNCFELGRAFDVSQGAVEATDKVSRKALEGMKGAEFNAGDGVFVLSGDEIKKLNLSTSEKKVIKKYLDSNDVGRYFINHCDEYLIYADKDAKEQIRKGEYLNLKKHLNKMRPFITSSNKPYGIHRPRDIKFFECPKLICKGMFASPEFSYDEDKYYVGFSFSVIIQKDNKYSLKYLLGIMNSSLGGYWFSGHGKKRGVGVDIGVLVYRKFPVHQATTKEQTSLIKLVDNILDLNNKYLKVKDKQTSETERLKRQIEETDEEIDQLVYKLYGLTEEEIKVVEGEK